jgi:transcriptional regulator with XRE-family HTH domain
MVDISNQQDRLQKFRQSVGQEMWRIRERRGMSLRRLSEESGISHRALWRIEHAKTNPRLSTLFLVAEALKVPVTDLVSVQPVTFVGGKGDPQWLVQFHIPTELAQRLHDEIERCIGGWLLATLTNRGFVGWLATQIRLAVLEQMYGPLDESRPKALEERALYEFFHPRARQYGPPSGELQAGDKAEDSPIEDG